MKIALLIAAITITTLGAPALSFADFLGLTPGDYAVTLTGSSGLCGGSDCAGTVHVPATNASLLTEFDWSFVIGGVTFDWTPPGLDTDISPNGINSCAIEGPPAALCAVTDTGVGTTLNEAPFLELLSIAGSHQYGTVLADESRASGTFVATPLTPTVPEPASGLLLLSGIAAWAAARRLLARRP